jgi:hypothetical protein
MSGGFVDMPVQGEHWLDALDHRPYCRAAHRLHYDLPTAGDDLFFFLKIMDLPSTVYQKDPFRIREGPAGSSLISSEVDAFQPIPVERIGKSS